ncbi:E3 ubiquitin-protein ligase SIRP1-like [Mercurialis annua]|uniref:E3 ubiquitin-protein ligase SIRP1-like n=1 Tax=Mercurialis annua TaxID=3986 RepID=UPI0021609EFA|nr:E3 ubiquitin-protein ligase SIRP1-like [Mercurialis annua]
MEETMAARYWCHLCAQMVNPIMEVEIKCPFCQSGFVEEMSSSTREAEAEADSDLSSDRALSLWAPILLGMMGNPRRRRRLRRSEFEEDDEDNNDERRVGEIDIDRELESFMRRRRRNSATILQLLQGIRAGMVSESENHEGDGERERVILINPLNRTIIVQGGQNQNQTPIGSLGDYFMGPGLDLLLQHLAENDPNRYGTPPAHKEAIESLPNATIKECTQCAVCLDDFDIGTRAKEMPCKHRFHDSCILPWLELHSSCPVCRFQLPAEESKSDSESSRNDSNPPVAESNNGDTNGNNNGDTSDNNNGNNNGDTNGNNNGNGRRFSFLWPFNSLFSSSSSSSSSSSGGTSSQTDEN